jgi:hypothetical protein
MARTWGPVRYSTHLCGLGDALTKHFDFEVPMGGVQGDGHDACGRRGGR